jgi:hypothetical protein
LFSRIDRRLFEAVCGEMATSWIHSGALYGGPPASKFVEAVLKRHGTFLSLRFQLELPAATLLHPTARWAE